MCIVTGMQKEDRATTIVAHNGEFHADDVFAVAALKIFLGNKEVEIIRTRDADLISEADFVVDVGRIHDESTKRFDHHQAGGAGKRENGIPYASFGLVWRVYGRIISGSEETAEVVDQRLVQPIDALDNGISITKEIFSGIRPYDISSVIGIMNQSCSDYSDSCLNSKFAEAVKLAEQIINLEISSAKLALEGKKIFSEAYSKSEDKRLVILDQDCAWEGSMLDFKEVLFVVYPKEGYWRIKAVRLASNTFENRKNLPESWAGKTGEDLSRATGVPGGVFCHNTPFIAVAETKEGAVKMAQIAVNS